MEEVRNKQVVLSEYVGSGRTPKESDMAVVTDRATRLNLPEGSESGILVKNLYLSCDPYMRILMAENSLSIFAPYATDSPIRGYGVSKVLDSRHPDFKPGDLVWGLTGWEEYTVHEKPDSLFKIEHTDVPLSFYTGILAL